MKPSVVLVGWSDTLQRCSRVKIIQLPAIQGLLSAHQRVIRLYIKSAGQSKYKIGLGGRIYNLFLKLLARRF